MTYNENMGITEELYNEQRTVSKFFGKIKARDIFELKILHYSYCEGEFGYIMYFDLEDPITKDLFTYTGSVDLGMPEQIIKIKATIKKHKVKNGKNFTVLQRPVKISDEPKSRPFRRLGI